MSNIPDKKLHEVVDEVVLLDDIFHPPKDQCTHVMLDDTFIPLTEDNTLIGCLAKCANCGEFVEYSCPCAVGAFEEDEYGNTVIMFACDLKKNEPFVEGLDFSYDEVG